MSFIEGTGTMEQLGWDLGVSEQKPTQSFRAKGTFVMGRTRRLDVSAYFGGPASAAESGVLALWLG